MRCVIVGAGPSGLSSGIQFLLEAKQNSSECECIIIEKDISQNKPCGGLITSKSKELLEQLGISINFLYCNDVSVGCNNLNFSYSTSEPFYLCHRSDLIHEMNKRFQLLGGRIIWDKVVSIKAETCEVYTENKAYKYDVLIIAHGNAKRERESSTYRTACSQKLPIGVSAIISPTGNILNDHKIHIWFINGLEGYGWCFPLPSGMVNVGFAGFIEKKSRYNYLYVKRKFEDILGEKVSNYRGCILPIDVCRNPNQYCKIVNNIYRVGEAGGYFDSLTGEGIYWALYTGILTAKYITKSIKTKEYENGLNTVHKICKGSAFTRNVLFTKRIILSTLLYIAKYSKQIDAHVTDNLILKYKYDYYSAYLSPFFCYAKFRVPFDFQNKLDDIIGTN